MRKLDFLTNVWKNLKNTPFRQEKAEQINITMLDIKEKVEVEQWSRLEELEEGAELVIAAVKEIYNRNK